MEEKGGIIIAINQEGWKECALAPMLFVVFTDTICKNPPVSFTVSVHT